MSRNFHRGLPGLQIDWKDSSELEYFGQAVLLGQSKYTSAQFNVGGKVYRCRYPVIVSRDGGVLAVEYDENPKNWPKSWGIYKGTLIIRFRETEGLEPESIEWILRGESQPYILKRGEDWIFTKLQDDAQSVKLKTRGTMTTSRQLRPEQKEMRNRLISMYGACQLTGVKALEALEACHIVPVKNGGDDTLSNSLLLRRDLHTLFDSGLLRLRKERNAWRIMIDDEVTDEIYRSLDGKRLPAKALRIHAAHLKARESHEPGQG